MYHGILNVYKERGYTSHDVVAKLRGIWKQKKIGHTGTLDPEAEGVLPVCLGNATKLCGLLTEHSKTYEAVLKLGVATDTQDLTGSVLEQRDVVWDQEKLERILRDFTGDILQVPPMYSALKVQGKKLYELARAGIEVERKPRPVTVESLRILSVNPQLSEAALEIVCSKGTYIRTLCHEIGASYGCGGAMKQLTRTRVERFLLADSLTLAEIEQKREAGKEKDILLSVDAVFMEYPEVAVLPEQDKLLYNGNVIRMPKEAKAPLENGKARLCRVYDSKGGFCALYEIGRTGEGWKPYKMFL